MEKVRVRVRVRVRVLWGCQNLSAAKRSGFEVSPGLEG
jgi:hypothetical protein